MNTYWIKNKIFVLTGSDDLTKEMYTQIINDAEGKVYSKVLDKVNYVIWNPDFDHETKKLITAQELNARDGELITIITEKEFEAILRGESIELSTKQTSNTHKFVKEFNTKTQTDKVEEYISTHDLKERITQEYLLELLEVYWEQSIRKPLEWCNKIIESDGYYIDLYLYAAQYFSRIGDYELTKQFLEKFQNDIIDGKPLSGLHYGAYGALKEIDYLYRKNNSYLDKPYWPAKPYRRKEICEIYDEKGIEHAEPTYGTSRVTHKTKIRGKLTYNDSIKAISEEEIAVRKQADYDEYYEKYIAPDYLSNSDNKYTRATSKFGLNVEGLSDGGLKILFDNGLINGLADIYRLKDQKDYIIENKIFTLKKIDTILEAIEKSRKVPDINLLYALQIPGISLERCKNILEKYSYEEIFEMAKETDDIAEFADIEDISIDKSSKIIFWFKDENNIKMLDELLTEITVIEISKEEKGKKCEGLSFVVTGAVYNFKNRKELTDYIESEGGKTGSTVNKDTSYLINNDIESNSSKNKKAKALNIPIISEAVFLEMFGKKD